MLECQTQSGPSSKKEVGRKRVKEMAQPLGALDGLAADLACLLNGGAGSLPTNELRTNSPANREITRGFREFGRRICALDSAMSTNLWQLPSRVPIFLRNRTGNYHLGIRELHVPDTSRLMAGVSQDLCCG
jgi:hypothetical protein